MTCFSLCAMSKWTANFAGEMNSCFVQKYSGDQLCILPNQHADHLLGLSQMAIWKAFSRFLFMWCNCPLFSMTHLSFYAKNRIILYFFLSFWRVWHDFNVSVFLTRKEHMWYFENWPNLTAWKLTLRICNFLTLPCEIHVCLLLGPGNLKHCMQHHLRLLLKFFKVKYRKMRSI